MPKNWNYSRRKGFKNSTFKPNQAYIDQAVFEYLKRGGTITKIELDDDSYHDYISMYDNSGADEFLIGI